MRTLKARYRYQADFEAELSDPTPEDIERVMALLRVQVKVTDGKPEITCLVPAKQIDWEFPKNACRLRGQNQGLAEREALRLGLFQQ